MCPAGLRRICALWGAVPFGFLLGSRGSTPARACGGEVDAIKGVAGQRGDLVDKMVDSWRRTGGNAGDCSMIIGIGLLPKSVDCRVKVGAQEKSRPEGRLEKFWERMPERRGRIWWCDDVLAIARNARDHSRRARVIQVNARTHLRRRA